ncbi:MAG: hypothetical protein U0905_08155 [Pirellulales bacterium]
MENQVAPKPMILVIEPDPVFLTGISAVLDQEGYRCFLSRDLTVANKALEKIVFDLIILSAPPDPLAAQQQAIDLRTQPNAKDIPIVFLTSCWEESWRELLQSVGGVSCLSSPFDPHTLIKTVADAVWLPHLASAKVGPPKAHFLHDWVRLS